MRGSRSRGGLIRQGGWYHGGKWMESDFPGFSGITADNCIVQQVLVKNMGIRTQPATKSDKFTSEAGGPESGEQHDVHGHDDAIVQCVGDDRGDEGPSPLTCDAEARGQSAKGWNEHQALRMNRREDE